MTHSDPKALARQAITSLDLTNLNDDCSKADVIDLCARAATPYGDTAAVCIWPHFVPLAKQNLAGSAIRIATVVNFPHGGEDTASVVAETKKAVADGADEIDMVMTYRRVADRPADAQTQIAAIRDAAREQILKVILETGELKDAVLIRKAAEIAIAAGADFIKTSTGKVPVNATAAAARVMLSVIAGHHGRIGFKPAGGIRTLDDVALYFGLVDEILGPDWATPKTFRIGASSVLDALIATLEDREGGAAESGGY
jgi:deoxyribose-phosphate aldolase